MPSIRVVVQKEDMEDMDVCFWHKADMLNALTNVRFWGLSGLDQPLLTNLDWSTRQCSRGIFESRRPRPDLF
jgi:hypothetical protein